MIDQKLQGLLKSLRVHHHGQRHELTLARCILFHNDAHLERWALDEVRLQEAHNLMELDLFLSTKDALKLAVQVNEATIV